MLAFWKIVPLRSLFILKDSQYIGLSEEFMAEGNCNKWHSIYHIQYCYIVLFISINIMYNLL